MTNFETVLKKHLDIFTGQEMYFVNDTRNLELFSKTPGNSKAEDVRTKVSALNDADVRTLLLEEDMINHIVKLNIDDRLKQKDITLVEEIAHINAQGKGHHLLHFASVYCNLHDPENFPIYSEQHFLFTENISRNTNYRLIRKTKHLCCVLPSIERSGKETRLKS